jgi:hypothetical protein
LGFGFVSAQSQAAAGMLLRQSLAKTQKSSLRVATVFFQTLSLRLPVSERGLPDIVPLRFSDRRRIETGCRNKEPFYPAI